MRHLIIGTAGHVDHGKTTLIRALTAIDTDRLQEEKQRGISIDLGFAHFQLPCGMTAGIVDVPGHERFIKNMMAGASGMDLVLLVVAADEGVMPQTIEHLQILSMFHVKKGVVVITKTDLVDEKHLNLVEQEMRQQLQDTNFAHSPLIKVSVRSGRGMDELVAVLDRIAVRMALKPTQQPFRMPVDRVFSVTGFGTVVTGTIWNGMIATDDQLRLYPHNQVLRVRGIEVFGQKVKRATAGQRAAINVADIEVGNMRRGCVLAHDEWVHRGTRIYVWFRKLTDTIVLKNNMQIRAYIGTTEILGQIIPSACGWQEGDQQGCVELKLIKTATAIPGDQIILRRHSPQKLLGGGTILAIADHRDKTLLLNERNQALRDNDCAFMIQTMLREAQTAITLRMLRYRCGILVDEQFADCLENLIRQGCVVRVSASGQDPWYLTPEAMQDKWAVLERELHAFHVRYPYRDGMPIGQLACIWRQSEEKERQLLLQYLHDQRKIQRRRDTIALITHDVRYEQQGQHVREDIETQCRKNLFQPPEVELIGDGMPDRRFYREILQQLIKQRIVIQVGQVVFHRDAIEQALALLVQNYPVGHCFRVAEFRDLLQTSRKYVLLLLGYFDEQGWTQRQQDQRIVKDAARNLNNRNIPPC